MEIVSFEKSHTDEITNVSDALRITFSMVEGGLNEIKFIRTSTNSRDPKTYKAYLTDQDMFDLEETIRLYNEGLNNGKA